MHFPSFYRLRVHHVTYSLFNEVPSERALLQMIFWSWVIHRKKKDGGCTFYHNTLRTKLSPPGKWKDVV